MLRIDTKINQLVELRRFSCLACPNPDCLKNDRVVIDLHFKNFSNLVTYLLDDRKCH
jgi:hypothetical protein